jgi:acetyl esterase/lipase
MPIHPWLAARFESIRGVPSFDAARTDPGYGARLLEFLQDPQPWSRPAGVTATDADAGGVRVKVFTPAEPADPTTALLWMHGGGFVMGSVDETESLVPGFELAGRAGVVVVSAGYRLAVDGVRYPAPLDDVMTAWDWLQATGFSRTFIGGASVGANLATAAAVRLRDAGEPMPAGMLLAYPLEHFPVPPVDAALAAELAGIPQMLRFPVEYQQGIVRNYLGRLDDLPADVVPGDFDVSGLPEAWIAPAEYDDLRPSGELFARQLADAGVPAHLRVASGMVHGYLGRTPSLEPVAETLDFFAGAMR